MRIFIKYIILIPILFLSGCEIAKLARTQSILIQTPHADGAKCTLTDARGRKWKMRKTPSTVAVEDGHSPLQVICTKKGYKTAVKTVNEHKEELLTIDGERVTMSLHDRFPERSPRLLPTALKEATSFILDPTGNISTKYPDEITIWMEPVVWPSEDHMRKWAYDKRVWENKNFLKEDYAELKDEKRKEIRRSKKKEREDEYQESIEKAKGIVDPKNWANAIRKGAKWSVDGTGEIVSGTLDAGGIAVVKSTDIVGETVEKVIPREGIESAIDKMKNRKKGNDGKWYPSQKSKLEKSKWMPNWLKNSTESKVGNKNKKSDSEESESEDAKDDDIADSKLEQRIKEIEAKNPMSDTPPWELE